MLHSMTPSVVDIPNKMGSSSALTSAEMIGFFIFWMVHPLSESGFRKANQIGRASCRERVS